MENSQKETINEALGLTQEWRDFMIDAVESSVNKAEKLSDVMEDIALCIKTDEFGDPGSKGYELTAYEKKLVYAGHMISQEIQHLQALVAKKEIMTDLLKMMLNKGTNLEDLFGDNPKDGE